jgi:autotransporter-associated beta strand protein
LTIAATKTLTLGGSNASGNTIISGAIGNTSGKLIVNTAGTVTLAGANTFTGGLTLTAGTLKATTANGNLGNGTLSLGGGTLQLADSAGRSYGRNTTITGNTQIISDKSTSSAGVNYTFGTLAIGGQTLTVSKGANATGSTARVTFGATTLSGASVFSIGSLSNLTLGAVTNNGNTLTLTGGGSFAQSAGFAAGAGGLTLDSGFSGLATLSQTNLYSGVTTINGGTLSVAGSANLGDASATNTIAISGGVLNVTAGTDLTANRSISLGAGGGTVTTNVSSSTVTVSGAISGSALTIDGGGAALASTTKLILSSSNSFTGGVTFNNASSRFLDLGIGNNYALGSGTLTVAATRESIHAAGGARTIANDIQIATAGTIGFTISGSNDLTIAGRFLNNLSNSINITNAGLTTFSGGFVLNSGTAAGTLVTVGNGGVGSLLVNSVISDDLASTGAALAFTGTTGSVLTLSGSNTFRGGLNAGSAAATGATVNLQNDKALGAAGAATNSNRVFAGNAFELQNNITIAGEALQIAGAGVNGNGAVRNVSGSNSWAGVVTLSDNNSLIKSEAGKLTLSTSGSNAITGNFNLTLDGAGDINIAGSVTTGATGSVTKNGSGIVTLGGANTYGGATVINAGTLLVNGSLSAGSAVALNAAILGGTGTINGLVTTSGTGSTLSPGNSPGVLTLNGGLNASSGATFVFELGTSPEVLSLGSGVLTGSSLAGGLVFNFSDGGGLVAGNPYTLITFGSSTGLNYSDLSAAVLPPGYFLDTSFGTGGFQINGTNLQVQFVPEPSTSLMLGVAGLLLAGNRSRRRK